MRSTNSYRPQNLKPDGLVQSRKKVAEQHYQQVRVTIQAMLRRGLEAHNITVPAVAKEAGVLKVNYFCPQMAITLAESSFLEPARKAEQGTRDNDAARSLRQSPSKRQLPFDSRTTTASPSQAQPLQKDGPHVLALPESSPRQPYPE